MRVCCGTGTYAHGWKAVCGIFCMLAVMLLLLGGCTHEGVHTDVTPGPDMTPYPTARIPAPKIELEFITIHGIDMPNLTGHPYRETINSQLNGYYRPIADAMKAWFADSSFRIEHVLFEEEGVYRLRSRLILPPYSSMELASVSLEIDTDEVAFDTEPRLDALRDADYMRDLETLLRWGVDLDLHDYGTNASQAMMNRLFAAGYEQLARHGVDDSRIVGNVADRDLRKALALDLLDYYPGIEAGYEIPIYVPDMQRTMARWVVAAERDIYMKYSANATVQDVLDMLDLFLYRDMWCDLHSMTAEEESPDEETAQQPADIPEKDAYFLETIPSAYAEGVNDSIVRRDLAAMMVAVYEDLFGEIDISDRSRITPPRDADDPAVLKAIARMIMMNYPSHATFEPELDVQFYALPGLVNRFANQVYLDWIYETGCIELPPVRTEQLIRVFMEAMHAYESREPIHMPAQQVSLDREWDWYMNQYDTGAYNYINCMPTLAAMVMKWLDPDSDVTPQELRESIPENTGGWYMHNVERVMDQYGIRYVSKRVSLEGILSDIDAGNLAFCQINEGDVTQNGHCFLVYGYRRQGDNLWLLVQDPASAFVNQHGEPEGKARLIDARYAEWIIARFSSRYLSIPPIAENLYIAAE